MDSFLSPYEHSLSESVLPGSGAYSRRTGRLQADVLRLQSVRSPVPFVWQSERRLLLLDEEEGLWVFAELEFDSGICRYVEIRRAAYEMEREAVGVLLSRALASGMKAVEGSAVSLNSWLIKYFGHSIQESRTRPRSRAF